MKLVRSLVLGGAAVFTVVAGAQAADLPSRKAAPVQYVRVCDAYGAGFFYIPGTDTCLRVGGYVRYELDAAPGQKIINVTSGTVSQVARDQDSTGMEARGRVDLDARTQTSWGTVQTVINLRGTNTDGLRTTGSSSNFQTAYAPAGNGSSSLTMERAFIRFAGFTAGVASENATTMPSYIYAGNVYAGFPNGIKQFAYTATFGGGISATIAAESRGDFGYSSTQAAGTYVNQPDTGYMLVGNVRDDQAWGFVQIAGLAGNDSATYNNANGTYSETNNLLSGPTTYGAYGFIGSFRINTPMITPGDQFNFQFGYGHGFIGAVLSSGGLSDLSDASNKRGLGGVIRVDSNLVPSNVNSTGGVTSYALTDAWGVDAMYTHYWTPSWRSNFALQYAQITPPSANANGTGAGLNTQWGRGDLFVAVGQLIWSPAKNFDIGVEAEYLNLSSKLQNPTAAFLAQGEPGLNEDGFVYHVRLERQF